MIFTAGTRDLIVIVLLCALAMTGRELAAQQRPITVEVVDGKTGKPIAHHHLLAFFGSTPAEVEHKAHSLDIQTDALGRANLDLSSNSAFIQVWVNGHTLCQSHPKAHTFSVREIVEHGLSAPNNCGEITKPTAPTTFIVFVRNPTFREKMQY